MNDSGFNCLTAEQARSVPALIVPDIGDVPWPSSRNDEHRVDPDRVAGTGVARDQRLGGAGDPAQPPIVERQRRIRFGGARFHLDEGEHAAAPGDQIDLADPGADAHREDAPAVQPEPPGRDPLGPPPAALGRAPSHFSACARA